MPISSRRPPGTGAGHEAHAPVVAAVAAPDRRAPLALPAALVVVAEQDRRRHAAQQRAADARTAVCAHEDHARVALGGDLHDRVPDRLGDLADDPRGLEPGLGGKLGALPSQPLAGGADAVGPDVQPCEGDRGLRCGRAVVGDDDGPVHVHAWKPDLPGENDPVMSEATAPVPEEERLDHTGVGARRVMVAAGAGLVVAAITLIAGVSWSVAALFASDIAALVFVVWAWSAVWRLDGAGTARLARAADPSRAASDAVLVAAGTASLIAVAFTLAQAGHAGSPQRGLLTALAIVSVALAWSSVHTVFALAYARAYYSPPDGGVDFHGDHPDYVDFAYLALTIGMTFQVSDTDVTAKGIRRRAIQHALLSYVFGTVIVAVTVNTVAGLLTK
jgi:uncharacterized membrane protein